MAKFETPSLWLGPAVPHIVRVEGENGDVKEFSFRLLLNFNALRTIERFTGIPLSNPLAFFPACQLAGNQAILFWAATHAYHPEYRDDKALDFIGSLFNYKNAGPANDAVFEAFLKSLPTEAAEKIRKMAEDAKDNLEKGVEPNADPQKNTTAVKN